MKRITAFVSTFFCLAAATINASCQEAVAGSHDGFAFELAGSYGNEPTFQLALGDLDNDGDLDAVFANMHGMSGIWTNDGGGVFTNSGQELGYDAHGVGIGDLDGDGDPDLLIVRASSTTPSSVFLNDGSGAFSPADGDLGDLSQAANFVSLFDLEGDGDLDAGVYYADRYSVLYTNDGTGRFEATGPTIPGLASWGDIDGDGDADAVVQRFETGYLVLRHTGGGSFEEIEALDVPSSFGPPGSAALADLDNDGDLDLVDADGSISEDTPLTILVNDGTGSFSVDPEGRFLTSFAMLSVGDLNGDGKLDVLRCRLDAPNAIALGDGNGGFVDSDLRFGGDFMKGASAIGDLDGDGDLDVFIARYGEGGPNPVWLNQRVPQ